MENPIPVFIYFGMGLVLAFIQVEGISLRGYSPLQWLQFLLNLARWVLLWPLVLFLERVEGWMKEED